MLYNEYFMSCIISFHNICNFILSFNMYYFHLYVDYNLYIILHIPFVGITHFIIYVSSIFLILHIIILHSMTSHS